LLMCWPTPTLAPAYAAIEWGRAKDIVYIGETVDVSIGQFGGCATDEFFEITERVSTFSTYVGNMCEWAGVMRLRDPESGSR